MLRVFCFKSIPYPIPLGGDPGHMLYYVVKNKVIQVVYSLGPRDSSNSLNGILGLSSILKLNYEIEAESLSD